MGLILGKRIHEQKEVAWGVVSEGVTPKKLVNEWYKKAPIIPAEVSVHN